METQQSVANKGISTFLSFGAKNVQPDILEKMLVGRQKTVNLLEQYAWEIALNGVNHQVFIVGPRGSGKTHMLRVLYHRIQDLIQSRSIIVSYFAEEEYGISGYLDFLTRIINAFMRWYDDDREALEAQLTVLRETPESRQEYVAETIISDHLGDKPLLILSENFDTILEALGKDGQSKLRAWLYRHNRISTMATSQAASPDLGREDRPFYGFFSTITLKKLTYEESLELLRSLARIEQNQTMIEHLAGKGQAQVRAIHELVKGNHRLLVTFYEFLKADTLADLSIIFMKTMNNLKPYYETFIRFLPAQQQKILYYLALAKIPQKGTDIAKNCFIATTSLTKQLSELQRQHLIDALTDPNDKRNKLYDVSEPLLRIAIEIGEQREGITSLFIDFLALYYSHEEIKSQKARFESMYQSEIEPLQKQKLYYEIDARERALKVQMELGVVEKDMLSQVQEQIILGETYYRDGNYEQAIKSYQKAVQIDSKNESTWAFLGLSYYKNNSFIEAIEAFQNVIKIHSNHGSIWGMLGNAFFNLKRYKESIDAYQKTIQLKADNKEIWEKLGISYAEQKEYIQAIEYFQKVIHINPDSAFSWNNLGNIYSNKGDFDRAMEAYGKANELDPNLEGIWYNIGCTYAKQNKHTKAIEAFRKEIQFKSDDEDSWYNLGCSYSSLNEYNQAVEAFQKAIQLRPDYEDAWGRLGIAYSNQGNYNQAAEAFQKTIQLKPNNQAGWYCLGVNYGEQSKYEEAINAYQKVIEIDPTNSATLENLPETIINFLQTQNTTELELTKLKTWLQGRAGFEIISTYVTTYRRVLFSKDEKALYDLPKEQRIFFEREILKRSTE